MILTSPILLTMKRHSPVIVNGAVVIRNNLIEVGEQTKILKKHKGHSVLNFKNAVLMPGLVNVHTHLELPPILDVIRAKTFTNWILNLISIKKELGFNDYRIAAQQNINTLIRTGTTTVGEICTYNISPSILGKSGLRAVVFREIIGMGSTRNIHVFKKGSLKRILNGISPHSPYTVSREILVHLKNAAHRHQLKLSMHVAESKDEINLLQRKKSELEKLYRVVGWKTEWAAADGSPFEYLDELGLLGRSFLAVHAVHATAHDIGILKKTQTPVAHCPRSNMELGVGKMPLKRFLDAGITVGLGTDSLASSPSLSMWDEMRYALRVHRRDSVSAEAIMRLATIGSAKALGLDKYIGSIEPGKKADIIAVPLPHKSTGDIYSDLLRETENSIMTMVNGKILYDALKNHTGK